MSTTVYVLLSLEFAKHLAFMHALMFCMLCGPVWSASFRSCVCAQLVWSAASATYAIYENIDALCRLWSTKQEQEKVLDEEATKRKQEAADAKVRCITHHCHGTNHTHQSVIKIPE